VYTHCRFLLARGADAFAKDTRQHMPGDSFDVTVTDAERAAVLRVLTQWRQQQQLKQLQLQQQQQQSKQQQQQQQQPIESDGTISDTNTSEGAVTDDAVEYRNNSIKAGNNHISNSSKNTKTCHIQAAQTRTTPDAASTTADSSNPFHSLSQQSSSCSDKLAQAQVGIIESAVLSSTSSSGSRNSFSSSCSSSRNAQIGSPPVTNEHGVPGKLQLCS
jgi:hypothetical protein